MAKKNVCGKDHRYNGWTNYETWALALWIDNDGEDSYWRERYVEAKDPENWAEHQREWVKKGTFTVDETAAGILAEEMKDAFEERMSEMLESASVSASMWADLLGAALSEVNWNEVASHYSEE